MKKITLLFALFLFNVLSAQVWTTGTIMLDSGSNYTVKFDVNVGTNTVTMTMIGPDSVWLGVGPGITAGNGMGNLDDDAIVYSSIGLEDRNTLSGTGQPPLDNPGNPIDEWTLVSDDVSGNMVTVIATRAIDTGDSEDFVFPTSAQPLPILWAHGNGTTNFGYHGPSNKAGVIAGLTLSNDSFDLKTALSFYPNPVKEQLNLSVSDLYNNSLQVEIFDVLGKLHIKKGISENLTEINTQNLNKGVYLIRLISSQTGETSIKKMIKM